MPITDQDILVLKPKATPYKVSIGKGAYLLVKPGGQKYWRLKYTLDGKESIYSLGVFPKVSFEAAKAASEAARALIRKGINPSTARRQARTESVLAQLVFRLGRTADGYLTIETETQCLIIRPEQAQALSVFLAVNYATGKESL